WEELVKVSKQVQAKQPDIEGFVFQGARSESGTVDALEFMYAAGAKILSEDGKESIADEGDGSEFAFQFLANLIKDGVSPKVVATYTEEEARLAFQNGGAVFMRNWPYAAGLMETDKTSKVRGKFKMALLPGFEGRADANVLGGQNFGIAAGTDDPELAWEALQCLGSAEMQAIKATAKGELPALKASYDDPKLEAQIDYLPLSKVAIARGLNRPESPYYGDVTSSIFKAYNSVLSGELSPAEAVKELDHGVQAAIDGKAEI
ncbi:MAG: extracellular solute-binding protein family 1, partial [Thermoleophilia bacterium]|nr:extracellular solute-binding protein family 1 [Thermoleophilia bacterium]